MSFYMHHVEREILSALIDGELDPEERRFVYEHLQQCEACREALDEFGHLHGLVGELPKLIAPEAFVSAALLPRERSPARAVADVALAGKRGWAALVAVLTAIAVTLAGLVAPQSGAEPPVDQLIARHVSVHSGVEAGGHVLFAVNGR